MILLLLLLMAVTPLTAQQLYLSDSLGLPGASADRTDEGEWVLLVQWEGLEDIRILYKDGEPYKRWERESLLDKGNLKITEKYYFGDSLRSESVMNRQEELLEERFYDSSGALLIENTFIYDETGRLIQMVRREDGSTDSSVYSLRYRDNGGLSRLDSENDRIDWRAGDYDEQFLDTLYLQDSERSYIYSYKGDLLSGKSLYVDEELVEESSYFYDDEGVLQKEVTHYPQNDGRKELFYNSQGNLIVENRYDKGILVFSLVNTWSSGRLVRRQQRTGGVRKLWTFEYDGDDSEAVLTKEYRNGQLVKETQLTETETIITLYRNNEAVSENRMPLKDSE